MAGDQNNPPAFDVGFDVQPLPQIRQSLDEAAAAVDTFHTILQTRVKQCIAYAQMHRNELDQCVRAAAQAALTEATNGKITLDNVLRQQVGNAVSAAWEYAATLGITPSFGAGSTQAGEAMPSNSLTDMPVGNQSIPPNPAVGIPNTGQGASNRQVRSPVLQAPSNGVTHWMAIVDIGQQAFLVLRTDVPEWEHYVKTRMVVPIRYEHNPLTDYVPGETTGGLQEGWTLYNSDMEQLWVEIATHAYFNGGELWPEGGDFPHHPTQNGERNGLPVGDWPFDANGNYTGPTGDYNYRS